jgi:hypothetical protein
MTAKSETSLNLMQRLWVYQAERFPLGKTATLLALFTAASINVSAALAGVARPGLGAYLAAFIGAIIVFAHLRICDEFKDAKDDARYRPERPVPRGLVTLPLLAGIGLVLAAVAMLAAAADAPKLVWLLVLVWAWLALMTAEFFVPDWLKARPVAYLVSHMLIMPLIDLYVTACEWLPRGDAPPSGLWVFLALSFVNGCVIELGRKIFAPASEREGVETYSAKWGITTAINRWIGCLIVSTVLLVIIGFYLNALIPVALVALPSLASAIAAARTFNAAPTLQGQKRLDLIAGLWVAMSYATAGFAPIIAGWLP